MKNRTHGAVWRTLMLSISVAGSSTALAGGWGQQTTITGYYVYDSGTAYMKTAANENPDSCTSSHYLYLDTNAERFKEMWATIMTAQTTGSTVSLRYEGCSPGGQYPRVIAVAVPQVW